MKDAWVKFGCFLTGYNYSIVKNCSEATAKAVKKYLSAILIVSTLWCFIGYAFTERYLHGSVALSLIGGLIMVIMIIQIERQIILTIGKNNWAYAFRFLIGIVMAILGSVILDQIIFKEDIEKAQISSIQTEVNNLLPIKTQELTLQIQQIESEILLKETERNNAIMEISRQPTIIIPSTKNEYEVDSTGKRIIKNVTISSNSIPNPKAELIPTIDDQIKVLRTQKIKKEDDKLNIQTFLEADLKSKTGFLDELKVLFSIIFSSVISFVIWLLLFLFFMAIELFVLVNKSGDLKNDYDLIIMHQMETRILMLKKLAENKEL